MKLHYIPIMIILASIIVLSTIEFIDDVGTHYSQTADFSDFDNTQTYLESQRALATALEDNLTAIKLAENTGETLLIPYNLLQAGWSMVKLMWGSWETIGALVEDSSTASSEVVGVSVLDNSLIASLKKGWTYIKSK